MEIPQSAENGHSNWSFEQSPLPGYESFGRNDSDWSWRRDASILECISHQSKEGEQIDGAIQYGT